MIRPTTITGSEQYFEAITSFTTLKPVKSAPISFENLDSLTVSTLGPLNSINTPFDIEMSGIPYIAQFACIELIALIVICFVIKKVLGIKFPTFFAIYESV